MTRPLDLPRLHAEHYERACAAQVELAQRYLGMEPPMLRLAAAACQLALQFEKQAQALEELANDLRRVQPAARVNP